MAKGSSDSMAAMTARLSVGKSGGKISKISAKSRAAKTSWNKTGKKTFAPGKK